MRTLFFISCFFLSLLVHAQEGDVVGGNDGLSGFLTLELKGNNNSFTSHKTIKVVDASDLTCVITGNTKYPDANIFLLKKSSNSNSGLGYKKMFGPVTDSNTYKKINDSLYEIYISDPAKEVLFGYRENDNYGIGIKGTNLGGLNSPNIMGADIDTLIIEGGVSNEKYKIRSFNPFLYGSELFVYNKKTSGNNQALTFRILFQFPKPRLITATADTAIINRKKLNPSFTYADIYASEKGNKIDTIFSKKNNSIVFAFEHFLSYDRFSYLDNLLYKVDDAQDWALTPLSQTPSILLENLPVGKHTLYVKYPAEKAAILTFGFIITPVWKDSPLWYILLGIIISATLFYFIFKSRVKTAKEKEQRTRLELQAIQAQLNPHFMFNALGSIQYLMNNNDKKHADEYLTRFSHLLRSSLNNNEKEMVPLSVEMETIKNYIQLEQLRFNFHSQINIDKAIQQENISVPTLLFQPLIENAFKHGISSLGEKGTLFLNISAYQTDLLIEITDNGKGFNPNQSFSGHGIKLVRERIKVLNRQGYIIELTISSNEKDKTVSHLLFKNWI